MAMPCETSVTTSPPHTRFLGFASQERNGPPRGIWSLRGDALVALDECAGAILLVPSEHVLLLAVELPLGSHRGRIEALPFAIEDRIAAALEDTHLALGPALAPNIYLAGVVRHDVMRQWLAALDAAGLGHAAIVPDALALAVPPAGAWSIALADGRAVVRTDDGAGFAIAEARLRAAWELAGRPSCLNCGDPPPPELGGEQPQGEVEPLARRLRAPALDLRQGRYQPRRAAMSPLRRRIAIVAASGLLAHGAIAAADTAALRNIAAEREAETRSLLAAAAPSRPIGGDVVTAATEMLPAGSAPPGRFLPLLTRISAAAAPSGVGLHSLSFDAREGRAALEVAGEIQRVESALAAAGLRVTNSSATTEGGPVRALLTVRDPAAETGR